MPAVGAGAALGGGGFVYGWVVYAGVHARDGAWLGKRGAGDEGKRGD